MPRHAAISRANASTDTGRGTPGTAAPGTHAAEAHHGHAATADDTITLALSRGDTALAWSALVQRCGSAQAAFEALVLLPAALEAAGIDAGLYMRCRHPR